MGSGRPGEPKHKKRRKRDNSKARARRIVLRQLATVLARIREHKVRVAAARRMQAVAERRRIMPRVTPGPGWEGPDYSDLYGHRGLAGPEEPWWVRHSWVIGGKRFWQHGYEPPPGVAGMPLDPPAHPDPAEPPQPPPSRNPLRRLTDAYRRQDPHVKACGAIGGTALTLACGFAPGIFHLTGLKIGFGICYIVFAFSVIAILLELVKPLASRALTVALATVLFTSGALASWKYSIHEAPPPASSAAVSESSPTVSLHITGFQVAPTFVKGGAILRTSVILHNDGPRIHVTNIDATMVAQGVLHVEDVRAAAASYTDFAHASHYDVPGGQDFAVNFDSAMVAPPLYALYERGDAPYYVDLRFYEKLNGAYSLAQEICIFKLATEPQFRFCSSDEAQ